MIGTSKVCYRCKATKPLTEFYKNRSRPDGHQHVCKACGKTYKSATRKKNRVDMDYYLRNTYGITADDYDRLFTEQGGRCAICLQAETNMLRGTVRRLSVDHDHKTGAVRGLLCSRCNRGIGLLRDDPAITEAATVYLRKER